MCKELQLEDLKKTKEVEKFCDQHGLLVKRCNGSHQIRGNHKGSFPLVISRQDIPKGTLSAMKKQIAALIAVCLALFAGVSFLF